MGKKKNNRGDEIEITPAMIAAGELAYDELHPFDDPSGPGPSVLVPEIYKAMVRASKP